MNLIDYFDRGVTLAPERLCLTDGKISLTYRETASRTHQIALALRAALGEDNANIAVYSPNHPLAFMAMLGIFRAGLAWVPINARNVFRENVEIMARTGVTWLFYHSDFEEDILSLGETLPGLRGCVCVDRPGHGAPDLSEWMQGHDGEAPPLSVDNDRLTMLASTGGTTGLPKGVRLTDRCLETMVASFLSMLQQGAAPPTHLLVTPMTHAAGALAFAMMPLAATQIFLPQGSDTGAILDAIEAHRVTHLFLPPTAIYMLLADPSVRQRDYSTLEYLLYAAAPMSLDKLREAMEVFGPVMAQSFGQAEAPMICTFFDRHEHRDAIDSGNSKRLLSCGRATPFTRIAIMDDLGNRLPNGERGEIVVSGNIVMGGYYNSPEATAEVSCNGWHRTGDIGYLDTDGYLYIVDRKKEMIITGGFNVYPAEVEQVILGFPDVRNCAVIGIPDDKWGEAVIAIVEPVPGFRIDTDALIQHCKNTLGSVKSPKRIEIQHELPRSAVGKIMKRELRERYWTDRHDGRSV